MAMPILYVAQFVLIAALTEHSLRRWRFTAGRVRGIRKYWLVPFALLSLLPLAGAFLPDVPARYACQAVGNVWLGFALYYGGLMAALTIAGAGIRALRGGRRGGERYGAALCLSLCGALALFGYGLVHTKNRMTPGELLSGADQSAPILVLQHEPVEFGSLAEAGADVALCDHTHAGQIFPGNLIVPFFISIKFFIKFF